MSSQVKEGRRQAILASLLLLASMSQAFGQTDPIPEHDAPTIDELVRRLEATEQELADLRQRDFQRYEETFAELDGLPARVRLAVARTTAFAGVAAIRNPSAKAWGRCANSVKKSSLGTQARGGLSLLAS